MERIQPAGLVSAIEGFPGEEWLTGRWRICGQVPERLPRLGDALCGWAHPAAEGTAFRGAQVAEAGGTKDGKFSHQLSVFSYQSIFNRDSSGGCFAPPRPPIPFRNPALPPVAEARNPELMRAGATKTDVVARISGIEPEAEGRADIEKQ